MKKIAWVTDSTAFLDAEMEAYTNLYRVPMTIMIDDKEYVEDVDITAEELYRKLPTLKVPAKTSQPSIGAFKDLYEKLEQEYDYIFSILVSAKLSGTCSSSQQAAQMVNIPVYTIDSKILSYPLSRLIKKGMELNEQGLEVEEIEQKLNEIAATNETLVLIGSLEQLHRSGRMSGLQFFLGSMLNVKPIISFNDGALESKEKARSERKAKDKIEKYLKESYEKQPFSEVYFLYGLHDNDAKKWQEELQPIYPNVKFGVYPIGATVGVHAGEATLGVSWFTGIDR
ncbi:DegV family protein [Bacillus sp. 31A1R]|uniref:DegV family protein n=1 Tax=Robertmurraya mangrovi TaxID=3098077 RepID=A0ABU5J1A5_9BACI|nr:DegV family protein [Bacillus sp. 31A1R]MDZ5473156.1 DegV family protein [Bacillus sp. 31A1R]